MFWQNKIKSFVLETDIVIALNWMAVHPSFRLRGIGSLLMDIGVVHADELDLECWMEASGMGKPLYEKFGFQSLLKIDFDTEKSNCSDEWRKCAHEMTPPPIFAMWRPKKSSVKGSQSTSRLPWALGTEG
jgi:predicted N-acetyltransferase YhbS